MKAVICRLLIVLMAWAPYQIAQAGMIATDKVVASTSQADRAAVASFVSRADVASQLQSFGIDASSARDRVAAMSDDEVRYVAGRIDSMPAGANGAGIVIVILLIVFAWWIWKQ
jgi:hypothetical protein